MNQAVTAASYHGSRSRPSRGRLARPPTLASVRVLASRTSLFTLVQPVHLPTHTAALESHCFVRSWLGSPNVLLLFLGSSLGTFS